MKNLLKTLFLNEKLILCVIILNAVLIFLQECGVNNPSIEVLDISCTFIFIIEMVVKLCCVGVREYWRSGWNKLDGVLVMLSLPSVMALFIPREFFDMDFLLVMRVLRVFRFFRLIHAFPNFVQIARNFKLALVQSYGVMIGLLIMIFIFALISCNIFGEAAPEFFDTPLNAIYSIFRIFTGEGWNEIPDTVSESMGTFYGHLVRIYFSVILIMGSIIGMSLVNSIFVDAMVSDNNDDLKVQLNEMQKSIDEIKDTLKTLGENKK